jgi:hypothetical protein
MNRRIRAAAALTTLGALASWAGWAALPASAAADSPAAPRVEVSADGLQRVVLPEETGPKGVNRGPGAREGALVVYPAAPDWVNSLRRQVGGLQIVDMNGDGHNDLVVGVYNSSSFPPYDDWHNLIYFNTGSELEASPSWISTDQVSTGDIQVAHLNGDTFPDVFAANGGFAMAPSVVYYGGAAGPSTSPGWTEAGGATWTNYAMPFDLDHDGDVDVVTANQGNSPTDPYRPMRLFASVEGVLQTTPSWQSAETSIQNFLSFGDLDHDGWEDLAVSKWANFESGVYRNAMGTLDTTPVWTTGDTDTDKGLGWAEVDGDEYPELALGHDPTQVFDNQTGTLVLDWSATGTFFGPQDLRWADVDGDGDPDLAEVHFSNGVVNLYLNQGGVLDSVPSWSYDGAAVGNAIAFGDLDGNGSLDLAVGYSGDPSILVFYNLLAAGAVFADGFENGDTSAWSEVSPLPAP